MRTITQFVCLTLFLIAPLGCEHSNDLSRKVISGTVTCDGENVPRGFVRFVPTGNTHEPATSALIHDGKYRADNRGGVPLERTASRSPPSVLQARRKKSHQ